MCRVASLKTWIDHLKRELTKSHWTTVAIVRIVFSKPQTGTRTLKVGLPGKCGICNIAHALVPVCLCTPKGWRKTFVIKFYGLSWISFYVKGQLAFGIGVLGLKAHVHNVNILIIIHYASLGGTLLYIIMHMPVKRYGSYLQWPHLPNPKLRSVIRNVVWQGDWIFKNLGCLGKRKCPSAVAVPMWIHFLAKY